MSKNNVNVEVDIHKNESSEKKLKRYQAIQEKYKVLKAGKDK